MDRRAFLKGSTLAGLAAPLLLSQVQQAVAAVSGKSAEALAQDEGFWRSVRGDYRLKPDYINLENGYYCFMPEATLERQVAHLRRVNYEGSYYAHGSAGQQAPGRGEGGRRGGGPG